MQKIMQNREEPNVGIVDVSVSFFIFFRQCALAALKDVHSYLSHEEGRVAVRKFAFSLGFLLGWRRANIY